ncbi:hypothetical protein WA538_005825 [Blastocystis sp. DL]
MGLGLLFGSILIAVGPSAIFFVNTVSRRPYLLIVSLLGFLQGILSFLIGGVVYSIWSIWATPISWVIVVLDILAMELLRPYVYKLVVFACDKLNAVEIPLSITAPSELYKLSVSIGMGNGFLNVLSICLVPLTSAGTGADYYLPTFPYISLFIVVAIESLCIMPMHMIWTYLTMRDYPKKSMAMPILVCVWHLFIGLITQLHNVRNGSFYVLAIFILSSLLSIFLEIRLVSTSCKLVRPLKKSS